MWHRFKHLLILITVFHGSQQGYHPQVYRRISINQTCSIEDQLNDVQAPTLSYCAAACLSNPSCGPFSFNKMNSSCSLCHEGTENYRWKINTHFYIKWRESIDYIVYETDGQDMENPSPQEIWKIDCNKDNSFKNGFIVGIWDDKHDFDDIDKIKCLRWKNKNIVDPLQSQLLHVGYEDLRSCPKGHVLTALSDKHPGFTEVELGKCSPLFDEYRVDPDRCASIATSGRDSGPNSPHAAWKVQCPDDKLYVAVAIYRKEGVHTHLICCILTDEPGIR
ncbi:uncharacterized protein [Centruroides vittatus]|uniref:uncharacterized protein n=1 Tax=Centruroides vittatus TaxID=120091 RepID=UPI00350EDA86